MFLKYALILGLLFVNGIVYATILPIDKFQLSAGLSYENTDNILLSPVNKKSENIIHTLINANYQKRSARVNANFTLHADHQDYQKHTFTNLTNVSSILSVVSALQKQRLFWDINNRLGRVQINQAAANIPTNQENTNYFTTGPRFVFFRNNKDSLNAGIKYEKFYTERSNGDYHGYIFNTSYFRNITHTTAMGLNVKYDDRRFNDLLLNANYKRTDLTIDLSKRMKLSTLEITVGRTILNYQTRPDNREGILRMNYHYQLGSQSTFDASYSKELTDFSNEFFTSTPGNATYTSVNSATFMQKLGQVSVVRNFSNTRLLYRFIYSGNDYSDSLLNIITRDSTISLSNKISAGVSLDVSASYRDTSYVAGSRVDLAKLFSLGLARNFFNSYNLRLNLMYINHDSTDSNFSYDERRISLSGNYYFR